jgi:hypothetical protein
LTGNRRIFFAVQQVALAPLGTTSYTSSHQIHGLQSCGITTNFRLEQVFELGQIEIYEQIENIPDIEITTEKVLDGYPGVYLHATRGAASASLSGRSATKTQFALSIFSDVQDAASGTPLGEVECSGVYVSRFSYNFPSDGNFTESVTLVGNEKIWRSSSFRLSGLFDNTDEPIAIAGSGGVNRREDLIYYPLASGNLYTLLPGDIDGVSSSGTNDKTSDDEYKVHVTRIGVNCDLRREELFELGRRAAYFRFVNFPVEVTSEFECISKRGDFVGATEDGVLGSGSGNLTNRTIRIVAREGTVLDLGTKNKLQTVTEDGGDATGGNVTVRYSYSNFNKLDVKHPADPTTSLRIPVLTLNQ